MHWSRRALLSLALTNAVPAAPPVLPNVAYNRLAFGPRPGDLESFARRGGFTDVDGAFPSVRLEGGREPLRALAMSPEFQLR